MVMLDEPSVPPAKRAKIMTSITELYPDTPVGLLLLNLVKKEWRVRSQVKLGFFDEFGAKNFVVDSCNDRHQGNSQMDGSITGD